jgi:hypothetical protein
MINSRNFDSTIVEMHENGSCWNDLCEQELNQQNQLTLGAIFVLRIQVVFKQLKLKSTIYITKKRGSVV